MFSILNPFENIRAFIDTFGILIRRRELAWKLTKRDIGSKHAGQFMGSFWAIIHPLFLIALYMFIFGVVMASRIGGTYEMPFDYIAFLLVGIIPWMYSQDLMSKATSAITGNSSLVKQVIFPIEILPFTSVLSASFSAVIALSALGVYVGATGQVHYQMLVLIPIVLLLHVMFLIGLAFALSAIAVFFRDIKEIVSLFSTAGIFMAPIIYLPSWVPDMFKPILYINPFSYIIWVYRDIFYYGRFEHPAAWVFVGLISPLSLTLGYRLLKKLKPYFGDHL